MEWIWRDSHGLAKGDVGGLAREELVRIINNLAL